MSDAERAQAILDLMEAAEIAANLNEEGAVQAILSEVERIAG